MTKAVKLAAWVKKLLAWLLPLVRVSRVRAGVVGGLITRATGTLSVAITDKFPAVAASKRRWQSQINRQDRGAPRLRFWPMLVWQTLTSRQMWPLSREMRDPYRVSGLEYLPRQGVFTLAVNHTMQRWLPRLMSAVHHATIEIRPDLAGDWLVVVGYRRVRLEGRKPFTRFIIQTGWRFSDWLFQRWQHNIIRLPMADGRASVLALREWRKRAKTQPSFVFPEGRGAKTFEDIRPGAGRWLAGLGGPVLPVSAWWDETIGSWQIVFGPPIEWSGQVRLRDFQIGLEIAAGLPPEHAPTWQAALQEWEAAYESEINILIK